MNNASLINQNSGNYEYYTPLFIIEAARTVLGAIDLDPASSKKANQNVKAASFFTVKDDGLCLEWFGRVWLNHPFGLDNKKWAAKFDEEYRNGRMKAGLCITFAATSEKWFQPLIQYPQCYLTPRTNYYTPNGQLKKGVTKGSVVTYAGGDVKKFRHVFSKFGTVKI